MLRCPYCNHPLREQAKFCNNCGGTIPAGVAPVAAAGEPPMTAGAGAPPASMAWSQEPFLSGKASPTGPLLRGSAAPGDASQPTEQEESGTPAIPTEEESLEPPPPPFAGAEDEFATERSSDVGDQMEQWSAQGAFYEQQPASLGPSEQLYGLDPYAAFSNQSVTEAREGAGQAEPLPEDEMPTIMRPRPDENNVEVTPELLGLLGEHTPLQPGMILDGRYRVEEVVHTSEEENLYRVIDEKGYLHCWNCGTDYPEAENPDRYCSNCGADMLGQVYWLRERPQGRATTEEMGQALSAASNGGAPGANGAHPDEATGTAPEAGSPGALENVPEELDWPTQPMTAIASFIIEPRHYRVEALEIEGPTFPLGVTLVAGARSDVGRTRRGNPNEDSILVMEFTRIHESITQPFGLYIVADGLGGHDDGQTASRRAVAVIADYITREVILPALQSSQFADQETLAARLKGAIEAANLALVGSNEQTGSDMGSTVTGALIVGDTAHIVNVGDSRTYLFDTSTLQPISVDHSLVMQLVIGGLIERDAIYTHPQRNQILRSLGDRRDVQIDLFTQKLRPGYQLVICCDGLWEMVRDPQIEQVLRETTDPQAAADQLVELANQNGGEDNISVIIVQARE
jgi:serine/threonine protein phosphatase PrpC